MKYQLDVSEYSCPVPLLMAKKALQQLAQGDELALLLHRQSATENFALFCAENNCRLLNQEWLNEDQFTVLLSK